MGEYDRIQWRDFSLEEWLKNYYLIGLEDKINKEDSMINERMIIKLQKENKILIVIGIIYTVILLSLSVYLIILEQQMELGIGLLISLPISIVAGAVLPIKANIKKNKNIKRRIKTEIIIIQG